MKQTTLANKVSCSGIGLHTGRVVKITLYPAEPNTGVVFKRLDVEHEKSLVPARYDAVCETRLGTTIRNRSGVTVSTIEHLMAALWGAGVDNVLVELDGSEVPIMDGSSEPFTFMIECARVVQQNATRRILRVLKTVEVHEGKSTARVQPNREGDEGCVLGVEIEFDNSVISRQVLQYDFRDVTFKQTLSRARTFGFEHEVEAMRANGLALGGSLDNAIVVGKEKILNEEGLRYVDEFVRHKALDCLGDLFLAGSRIDGRFDFSRPGHGINNALLRALFADKTAYAITSADAMPVPLLARPVKDAVAYA
ncbi:MAG: UDP-3-O-acyl-N-acetylglucosamine deacetylase [Alphaproteobacteria bacterium]